LRGIETSGAGFARCTYLNTRDESPMHKAIPPEYDEDGDTVLWDTIELEEAMAEVLNKRKLEKTKNFYKVIKEHQNAMIDKMEASKL